MNRRSTGFKIEAGPNVSSSNPDRADNVGDAQSQPVSRVTKAKVVAGLLLAGLTARSTETPEGYLKPGETPGHLEIDETTGKTRVVGQLYGAYGQPVAPPMGVENPDATQSPTPPAPEE